MNRRSVLPDRVLVLTGADQPEQGSDRAPLGVEIGETLIQVLRKLLIETLDLLIALREAVALLVDVLNRSQSRICHGLVS